MFDPLIPAKARIQLFYTQSRNFFWSPACAGMSGANIGRSSLRGAKATKQSRINGVQPGLLRRRAQ
jgi:hypothetical protein